MTGEDKIIYRKATLKDLPQLVELGVAQSSFHKSFSNYNKVKKSLAKILKSFFRKKIRSKNALFIVAETKGAVVGYALAQIKKPIPVYIWRKEVELSDLFIKQSFRHKGIGKKLFSEVKLFAREINADYLWVGADSKNHSARDFYGRVGFEPFREILLLRVKK